MQTVRKIGEKGSDEHRSVRVWVFALFSLAEQLMLAEANTKRFLLDNLRCCATGFWPAEEDPCLRTRSKESARKTEKKTDTSQTRARKEH